jgi:Tol biopolymer transport system component
MATARDSSPVRRLDSWKEIAAHFGKSVRTVQRWERTEGLPVHRHVHERRGTPFAFESELDVWFTTRRHQLETVSEPARVNYRRGLVVPALIALAAAAVSLAAWLLVRAPSAPMTAIPFFTESGLVPSMAISPDGTQVAFGWTGPEGNNYDIYVKAVSGGPARRLTTYPHVDEFPVWSPDSRSIAFTRNYAKGKNGVFVVPARGGEERMLADGKAGAWSPDGRCLAVIRQDSPFGPWSLALVSVASGEVRKLIMPPPPASGDFAPAFSPDGRSLLFHRAGSPGLHDLYLLRLSPNLEPAGEPVRITNDHAAIWGHSWMPDGKAIIFSSDRQGAQRLWKLVPGGLPELLSSLGDDAFGPSISKTGRMAFVRERADIDIWRANIRTRETRAFIASTRWDIRGQYSPDGRRIAFVSRRSGVEQIYTANADGSSPAPMPFPAGAVAGTLSWSPDSRSLVFSASIQGVSEIYVAPINGGDLRRLAVTPAAEPSWSRDGQQIYFTSNRGGANQIWRMPAEGGKPVQITSMGGAHPKESADGKWLCYSTGWNVWRVPAAGGPETELIPGVYGNAFVPVRDGIYHILSGAPGAQPIKFYRFATGESEEVLTLSERMADDLAISPDGKWLLFSLVKHEANEVMLVDKVQ